MEFPQQEREGGLGVDPSGNLGIEVQKSTSRGPLREFQYIVLKFLGLGFMLV